MRPMDRGTMDDWTRSLVDGRQLEVLPQSSGKPW